MKTKSTLLSLLAVCLTGVILTATPHSGAANPPSPESPAGPKANDSGERFAPGLEPAVVYETDHGTRLGSAIRTDGLGDTWAWAPLTYESYRDGNWEIYTAASDGYNTVRLTNHPATDVQPRLQRGGGRIVFASDRSGNAEIFSMTQDGSDVRQLTSHSAVDRNPNWSPDGSRIAFESNRAGQYEVYVMNADGSQVQRLTSSGGFDGEPAWSPDQSRIAFTSYRNGQWRIWAMNPDGTGQTQLSDRPYSERPVYSPDGQWLAYDSDADYNAQMEICVMPAGGGGCSYSFAYYPAYSVDSLARGFSPDSRMIAFTLAEWTVVGDQVFYVKSVLAAYSFAEYTSGALQSSGMDWNPDWQTMDLLAPRSRVNSLAPFSRAGSILVGWTGEDAGLAGIQNFDIEGKVGTNGVLQDFWTAVTATSSSYLGTAGDLVYFRSRARDLSNNVEAWPDAWDTFTYFFKWVIEGVVTDIAGVPQEGIGVAQSIAAYESSATQADGSYARHLAGEGPLTVSVAAPSSFGALPAARRTTAGDETLDLALPPGDNLTQNPWFDAEGLASWQPGGSLPTKADAELAHTGTGSAQLASRLAEEATLVAQNVGHANSQSLFRTADGALHLIRMQYYSRAIYMRRSPEGVWGAPEVITESCYSLRSRVAPDGTPHVFYLYDSKIYYTHRSAAGVWSAPEDASARFNGILTISFDIDNQGTMHAVWEQDGFMFYNSLAADGVWSGAQQVRSNALLPLIKALPDGSLYIAWNQWLNPDYASFGMKRSPSGSWGAVETLPVACANYPTRQFSTKPGGSLVMVYLCQSSLWMTTRDNEGVWSQPETIPAEVFLGSSFMVDFGADGSLHVVWSSNEDRFGYRVRYPDGVWSTTWYRSSNWETVYPLLAADNGAAELVWFENSDYLVIDMWEKHMVIPRVGDSTIEQAVHIPAGMHRPWLSFAYRAQSGSYLQAEFLAEVNGDEVFSTSEATGEWKYASADLSAYAGQDVTLTFRAASEGAAVPLKVNIDEVSIGSWRTPVVTGAGPQNWEEGPITISGENFIATPQVLLGEYQLANVTWIDENTLTADMPAGIMPGRYRVRVENPGGPVSSQQVFISLGKETFLPAILR